MYEMAEMKVSVKASLYREQVSLTWTVADAVREPESHRLSYHPPEGGAHLEARNEDAGGDRERGGQDGEEEGGDDVDCEHYEDVAGPRVLPVFDMVVLLHGELGHIPVMRIAVRVSPSTAPVTWTRCSY